jgi:hypothetical protein
VSEQRIDAAFAALYGVLSVEPGLSSRHALEVIAFELRGLTAERDRLRETLEWLRLVLDSWAVFREPQSYAVSSSGEMRDILHRIDAALAAQENTK